MPFKDPQKKKEYDKKYRETHREKMRIFRMKSYYKHRDKELARQIEYHKKNPHVAQKARLSYLKNHPERERIRVKKLSATRKGIKFDESKKLEEWLKNEKKVCHYCGVEEEKTGLSDFTNPHSQLLQIDRVVPQNGYVLGNIVLACSICNYIKGRWFNEKTMIEIGKKYVRELYI